jgi:hypothetical protein
MAESKFIPNNSNRSHCGDQPTFGRFSTRYDYPVKGITGDDDYPFDACDPWIHYNMRLGNLQVDSSINAGGVISAPRFQGSINVQSWKGFDIQHPTRQNSRIRHVCVEGPEAAVYIRGKLDNSNIIEVPEYWIGLVDLEQITVNLTPFGIPQNLYVETIEWGKNIIIKNADSGPVKCFYQVWAPRIGELHVTYQGESPEDYPGPQDEHSICGYHYDRR